MTLTPFHNDLFSFCQENSMQLLMQNFSSKVTVIMRETDARDRLQIALFKKSGYCSFDIFQSLIEEGTGGDSDSYFSRHRYYYCIICP